MSANDQSFRERRRERESDLRARVAELEGKLFRARDAVAAAGQREAWVVEVLTHAEAWMSEDGCDCGTDEPGTCALCEARAIISSPRSSVAQALARLVEAVDKLLNTPMGTEDWDQAMDAVGEDYDAFLDARSGRGEGAL